MSEPTSSSAARLGQRALFEPLTLARVKDLPLVAKTLAQGFLHGIHHSTQKGTGVEFSQYRSYEPGDALSKIDWKLFARSDKYFVREAQRESNVNVWLVIDASLSMLQRSEHNPKQDKQKHTQAWHKLDYARTLLATISYLAHQQGDAVGMLALSTEKSHFLPAYGGGQHWRKVLLQLANINSGGVFPPVQTLQNKLSHLQHNSLVLVVSDFYQKHNEITEFMSKLNPAKTDVVAIQLECDDELQFPYKGQIRFEDLESKEQVLVSAKDAKSTYLAARQNFNQQLSDQLKQLQIQHLRANIDKPLDTTLHQFLTARQRKR
ncbi:DUF58 domain-containing protein [Paraglaciecola sp.]|uniref:DUF58 domain-containing protein n=1 Tax=Paraglaciecola sp. TaxID=1920173 RepID=UPI0030F48D51